MKCFTIFVDPTPEQIETLLAESAQHAVRWLHHHSMGWKIYWKAEEAEFQDVAEVTRAEEYDTGTISAASSSEAASGGA